MEGRRTMIIPIMRDREDTLPAASLDNAPAADEEEKVPL